MRQKSTLASSIKKTWDIVSIPWQVRWTPWLCAQAIGSLCTPKTAGEEMKRQSLVPTKNTDGKTNESSANMSNQRPSRKSDRRTLHPASYFRLRNKSTTMSTSRMEASNRLDLSKRRLARHQDSGRASHRPKSKSSHTQSAFQALTKRPQLIRLPKSWPSLLRGAGMDRSLLKVNLVHLPSFMEVLNYHAVRPRAKRNQRLQRH